MSSSYPTSHPHFQNPWASTAPSTAALYAGSPVTQSGMPPNPMAMDRHSQQPSSRPPVTAPMAQYSSGGPVTSAPAGSPLSMVDPPLPGRPDLLSLPQDLMSISRMPHQTAASSYSDPAYHATAASPVHATYATSPTSYEHGMGYTSSAVRHPFGISSDADTRRYSQSSISSTASDPRGYQEPLEVAQQMVQMRFDTGSQETPRAGVYNNRGRGSGDSYGFPSTHSASSSVSSTGFSPYYGGSIDGSVSDYSTAGSDIESRTLPRPQGLMATQPPAPQSMMGQFSSKVSSSTQKKHKCKVCDKRFTRPSSLQTHMYSHTGEKPFKCEHPNCGRNFSVVSNLRRHRKVHKGEAQSDAGSEDQNQSD
ncbi:hypothetical protein M406DRAFT_45082 [Cryphonectria parasitica EP155]|uniref:C2H2-type domain-containing protein n=1 Tax=Cryphonectria parasitica (strain ATCC 38755 / EP155) TaxID=660469 RepID=A0A9P4Y9B7_CRYP1|nr:uncharacterized protein M406DRAFT_45082 [Cryphonectria parasitica EP155]KAF3769141.1 hypothetical protein M406DRAFT_45082 [Cryphonectria parasitica EP155]